MAAELLLEIGVEELPASFVDQAVKDLPKLLTEQLKALRLSHGEPQAAGTPRRLALLVPGVADSQPDLDEEVVGPPARIAFDGDGKPTKAAESFAKKNNVELSDLYTLEQKKGAYVAARRKEAGRDAFDLLPNVLSAVCCGITFRKSMRWSDGDTAFGRPVRWLVGMLGERVIPFTFAGLTADSETVGHRFLAPDSIRLTSPSDYFASLRQARVFADIAERKQAMNERLAKAAKAAGGELIEDPFLIGENASLVEDPQVVVGSFDSSFLELPERVILDVAKDHQRYFGMRTASGKLMPKYLAVVNTAEKPDNVRRGNDRVMRARLADAKFFYDEDLKRPLAERVKELDAVMFQKRLGSVGDKVRRMGRLVRAIADAQGTSSETAEKAGQAVELAKADLVTLMVFEFPELQGEMGQAYAVKQGIDPDVAQAISEHYSPRGASDPTAQGDLGALVGLADRFDTLVGCCAINVMPTGSADALGLRRAAIAILRTLIDKQWKLSVSDLVRAAYGQFDGVNLDLSEADTLHKLSGFMRHRLRGVLSDELPQDAVDACLDADADRPFDVALRAAALGRLDEGQRASVGEVFKRAANIAKDAPEGEPAPPDQVGKDVHSSEASLFKAFVELETALQAAKTGGDYAVALGAIGDFAPVLGKFFEDVFVMTDDLPVRDNRLRLMRSIHRRCSAFASFNLLAR